MWKALLACFVVPCVIICIYLSISVINVSPFQIRIRELHSAAINGDSAKVEAMTEGQARLMTSKDQNGLTILHKVQQTHSRVGDIELKWRSRR